MEFSKATISAVMDKIIKNSYLYDQHPQTGRKLKSDTLPAGSPLCKEEKEEW
jgi:hypothetical protein